MSTNRSTIRVVLAATLMCAAFGQRAAAQPRLTNGELRPVAMATLTRAALVAAARQAEAGWVGYAVPAAPGHHRDCCWSSDTIGCCEGCRLEPGRVAPATAPPSTGGTVRLEAGRTLHVLYRVERGQIDRIRTFSEDCLLDAGGLTVHWIGRVNPTDSVTVLASMLDESSPRRLVDSALSALASHESPVAADRLIAAARGGVTPHIRGQALFWLAERAGEKAAGVISEAVANDPETEVKRRAVFALSQLPANEGVPRLIELARSHTNPVVRKQAVFWLGQSRDPRALRFFEEILFK